MNKTRALNKNVNKLLVHRQRITTMTGHNLGNGKTVFKRRGRIIEAEAVTNQGETVTYHGQTVTYSGE